MRQAFQAFLALFGVIVIAILLAYGDRPASDRRRRGGESDDGRRGPVLRRTVALLRDRPAVVRTRCATQTHVRQSAGRSVLRRRRRAFPSFAWAQLAVALDGAPHSFYVAMLVLESALPPLMVVVAKQVAEPASV